MKKIHSLLLALVALAACALPAAHAQTTPTTQIVLTTATSSVLTSTGTSVAASGTATVLSQAFSPNSLTGFAVVPNFLLSGTGVASVTLNFQVSLDGTNWTTTYPYSCAFTATGTNAVVDFHDFIPTLSGSGAQNIPWIRLAQIVNANTPSTLTVNSITIVKTNR